MSKFEVDFKCVTVEDPEPTVETTTLEESTINSFYVNGLAQEYFIIFLNHFWWFNLRIM